MDNQHRKIDGYRELDEHEIAMINELKAREEEIGDVLRMVENHLEGIDDPAARRWAAIARTELETGFMYAIKAVARPGNGLGRK